MSKTTSQLNEYFNRNNSDHMLLLRSLLQETRLSEQYKWRGPVYCIGKENVVGLGQFKHWVALWFHQGVMLPDPDNVLINAQSGKTQAQRQWRFKPEDKIPKGKVRAYLKEAIQIAEQGLKMSPRKHVRLRLPGELKDALSADPKLKDAFDMLSPAKQREFAEHIAEAKKAETRVRRLERVTPLILKGEGLNDRYRS